MLPTRSLWKQTHRRKTRTVRLLSAIVLMLLPPPGWLVRAWLHLHPHNHQRQIASLSRKGKILGGPQSLCSRSVAGNAPARLSSYLSNHHPASHRYNHSLPGLRPPPLTMTPSLPFVQSSSSSTRRRRRSQLLHFGTVTTTTTTEEASSSVSSSSSSSSSSPAREGQQTLASPTTTSTAPNVIFPPPPSPSAAPSQHLDWEKFEFGHNPKRDQRFVSDDSDVRSANDAQLEVLQAIEAECDRNLAQDLQRQSDAWETLDLTVIRRATEVLRPYIQDRRLTKMQNVLARRTGHTRFLYENPTNPSNVWACLRTLDSFGIQHVNVVLASHQYRGKDALSMKRGIRTAMGSAHWLTVRNHKSTLDAVTHLKSQGFKLLAADVNPNARDIRTINWVLEAQRSPLCLIMGNEEAGISDEMRFMADETFYLPMDGFAESYNLSVATAIACAHLSAASSSNSNSENGGGKRDHDNPMAGPLRPGDLSVHERDCLLLKGMLHSVANKKIVPALLKQNNIVLPKEIYLL